MVFPNSAVDVLRAGPPPRLLTFHTAAVVIHEPCVSMLIFLDFLPQEGIGLITFGRAGLLVAKGGS